MTQRRLPASRPMGATSYDRGEEAVTPCHGKPEVYDHLITGRANESGYWRKAEEARAICATCPLFGKCMTENREEQWVQAVMGERILPKSPRSERRTKEESERTRRRVEAVRAVINRGGTLEEALRWTDLTPKGFYSWCRRNRLLDLYAALTAHEGRKPNQHRRNAA